MAKTAGMNGRGGVAARNSAGQELRVRRAPNKDAYRPGESIDYSGLLVTRGGEDVTAECRLSVEGGTAWRRQDKELVVAVRLGGRETSFKLRRKSRAAPVLLVLLAALCVAAVGLVVWHMARPPSANGSYIIPQGSMSDGEAQAMLDEAAEKSRITVSLRPRMELEDGELHVNFVVVPDNNGFSERLEIEQDGAVVYRSRVVEPGNMIEWGTADGAAHAGPATATAYAVTADGYDSGNPVSVEVEIIEGHDA